MIARKDMPRIEDSEMFPRCLESEVSFSTWLALYFGRGGRGRLGGGPGHGGSCEGRWAGMSKMFMFLEREREREREMFED